MATKKADVAVGDVWIAKVSGRLTRVRVDAIREDGTGRHKGYTLDGKGKGYAQATRYVVTNLATGRTTTFRSAVKFRKKVSSVGQSVPIEAKDNALPPNAGKPGYDTLSGEPMTEKECRHNQLSNPV